MIHVVSKVQRPRTITLTDGGEEMFRVDVETRPSHCLSSLTLTHEVALELVEMLNCHLENVL